jgi:hypothetical protein
MIRKNIEYAKKNMLEIKMFHGTIISFFINTRTLNITWTDVGQLQRLSQPKNTRKKRGEKEFWLVALAILV